MMILNIHVPGATPYEIGDEIWQESLVDAIRAEADQSAARGANQLLRRHAQHRVSGDRSQMPGSCGSGS